MRALVLLTPLVLLGLFLAGRWFARTPAPIVSRFLRRAGVVLAVAALVLLAASGRLHWLIALGGALIAGSLRLLPLLRYAPLLHQVWRRIRSAANPSSADNQSTVQTRFVRMCLDHASGQMSGEVLQGAFAGKQFRELSRAELIALFKECRREDPDSAKLLAAYLDRLYGADWHGEADPGTQTTSDTGSMTREEAYRVLGLQPGASDAEITEAHRRLMQKIHPDRGGSDYLAAKINQAKDLLLPSSMSAVIYLSLPKL